MRSYQLVERFLDSWRGLFKLQSTEPKAAAHGLTDSPLAWLAIKFQDFTDNDEDFIHVIDRDALLTNLTPYWVTNTVRSSMRIYRENQLAGGDAACPQSGPVAPPISGMWLPSSLRTMPGGSPARLLKSTAVYSWD